LQSPSDQIRIESSTFSWGTFNAMAHLPVQSIVRRNAAATVIAAMPITMIKRVAESSSRRGASCPDEGAGTRSGGAAGTSAASTPVPATPEE
jgi:hypothetical protein